MAFLHARAHPFPADIFTGAGHAPGDNTNLEEDKAPHFQLRGGRVRHYAPHGGDGSLNSGGKGDGRDKYDSFMPSIDPT